MIYHLLALAAFLALYRIVPAIRVGWRAAASGALAALILWNVTLKLFGVVIGRSPSAGMLTGTLAGSLAFLLWIYATVALTLYGAEVAAVVNGNRDPERD
jgi:membrane protein